MFEPIRPMPAALILVSGPPGAGKSTLADALARGARAVVLDKDCVDEPFSPNDRGERYTREIEPKVLQALLNLAERNLGLGHAVIVDVPWTHIFLNSPEWVARVEGVAKRAGAPLKVLELVLGEAELRRRLAGRGLERDRARLTDDGWAAFRRSDRLGEANPARHAVIDARRSTEECVQAAREALGWD